MKMRRTPKKNACKIMISCDEPAEDGKVQVKMTCEDDEILAAYLLENAQSFLGQTQTPSNVSSIGN